jgi:hypothetical protein
MIMDPYQNESTEDALTQVAERWEQDVCELEQEDWEFHLGGPDERDYEQPWIDECES